MFALIDSCQIISQNHHILSKKVILVKSHFLPETLICMFMVSSPLGEKNYHESFALISSFTCSSLHPVAILIREVFQHVLAFTYTNDLKPFSKGLKANKFSSNQSPDFSLDVLQDPNLQSLKKFFWKSQHTKPCTGQNG